MNNWMRSIEIIELYRVGVSQLERFAQRGNLGIKRDRFGQRLYDGQAVARLFPRRDAMLCASSSDSMGSLGGLRLGEGQHISILPTRSLGSVPQLRTA
jgi:hypothetical protein